MISDNAKKTFTHIPETLLSVSYFSKGNFSTSSRELVLLDKAFDYLENNDEYYLRPAYTIGRGRYTQNRDYSVEMIWILDEWLENNDVRYVYDRGNDAPRGGKCGKYIRIIKLG